MHQLRAKHLQAFAQLFDQVVDFFFDVGSFLDLVADVDVHSQTSEYGSRSREALRSYKPILHLVPAGERKLRLRCFTFVSFLRELLRKFRVARFQLWLYNSCPDPVTLME